MRESSLPVLFLTIASVEKLIFLKTIVFDAYNFSKLPPIWAHIMSLDKRITHQNNYEWFWCFILHTFKWKRIKNVRFLKATKSILYYAISWWARMFDLLSIAIYDLIKTQECSNQNLNSCVSSTHHLLFSEWIDQQMSKVYMF